MVEEKKKPAAKKAVASKSEVKVTEAKTTKTAVKKAPAAKKAAEAAVWPFPAVEGETLKAAAAATKAPAAKAAVRKPAVKKAAKVEAAEQQEIAQPSAQERYRMVETAAYYIAERSGWQGCTTEHWAAAEIEIAKKLGN